MIVRFIPPDMSGRAFGWVSLIRLIPYAVIPPFFDFMKIAPSSFGSVLNLAALAAILPILLLALPMPNQPAEPDGSRPPGLSGMLGSLRSPAVLMLLSSALLFFSGYSAIFFYLKQFGAARGIENTSLFFTIATVMMIIVRLFGGWLFDRYSKVLLCIAGLLAAVISYALLPVCTTGGMLFILAGVSGLGWGIAMPLQAAVMFDISTPQACGMNQNLLVVVMQGGFFLGPFFGGQVISCSGYSALFAGLSVVTLASLMMMVGVGRYAKKIR
jgi:predicted MFS family arabinose efflux permease